MAAIEGKYGTITASNKAFHPDEPVFLIRATDRKAAETIRHYIWLCEKMGCTFEHIDAAEKHLEQIQDWQEANPTLVKKPD